MCVYDVLRHYTRTCTYYISRVWRCSSLTPYSWYTRVCVSLDGCRRELGRYITSVVRLNRICGCIIGRFSLHADRDFRPFSRACTAMRWRRPNRRRVSPCTLYIMLWCSGGWPNSFWTRSTKINTLRLWASTSIENWSRSTVFDCNIAYIYPQRVSRVDTAYTRGVRTDHRYRR